MNEYQIECEVCEVVSTIYIESPDDEDTPAFCPMCGSALTPMEVTDV